MQNYLVQMESRSHLTQAIEHAVTGGKRLRPLLVYLIAEAIGRNYEPAHAALATEFFHTASLVADDLPCMDDDQHRRGKPSVHVLFGQPVALLTTYALISEGYRFLSCNSLISDEARILAIENVAQNTGILGATGGQFLDLFPPAATLETLQDIIYKKTVSLFEVAFVLGWIYGGGEITEIEKIKRAARHYGMAFQIVDDFEDMAQDSEYRRDVNFVLALGEKQACERLKEEIEAYSLSLQKLPIDLKRLLHLGEELKRRGEERLR